MNVDSKALSVIAALVLLGAGALFLLGRNASEPAGAAPAAPPDTSPDPTLHPKQAEARIAVAEGRLDDAREALASIPEFDPRYPAALADLAVLYESRGNVEAALSTALKLLNVAPEDSEGHHVMARVYYRLADHGQAERHALRALEIDAGNAPARYTIALVRLASGQLDRAIDAYLRAMRASSDSAHLDAALTDLTQLAQARPDFADVHYVRALFANSLGVRDQERLELARYLELQAVGTAADSARARLGALNPARAP